MGLIEACCWSNCLPRATIDEARLAYFLAQVPPALKVAVEFRNPSWNTEAVFGLLERHGAAYCVMSGARLPCVLRATAPFVYARLHGPDTQSLYAGSYSDDDLRWWSDRIREWDAQGRDVFVLLQQRRRRPRREERPDADAPGRNLALISAGRAAAASPSP